MLCPESAPPRPARGARNAFRGRKGPWGLPGPHTALTGRNFAAPGHGGTLAGGRTLRHRPMRGGGVNAEERCDHRAPAGSVKAPGGVDGGTPGFARSAQIPRRCLRASRTARDLEARRQGARGVGQSPTSGGVWMRCWFVPTSRLPQGAKRPLAEQKSRLGERSEP